MTSTKRGKPEPKVFKGLQIIVKIHNLFEKFNSLLKRVGKKQKQLSYSIQIAT